MLNAILTAMGRRLAHFLEKPLKGYETFSALEPGVLAASLRPGDVLLVEGNSRVSSAIKYLTRSTWSHAAFYAGADIAGQELIEADLEHGVRAVPVETYGRVNTRICRPVGLKGKDLAQVVAFMRGSVGMSYDLKNVLDLARYLLPTPPVPFRHRRRLLALGAGDPTRAICSTLIAQAFQSVRYPILPEVTLGCPDCFEDEILHIRHHSLFAPRDFDLSPYFRIVKPTIDDGFDHHSLVWGDRLPKPEPAQTLQQE